MGALIVLSPVVRGLPVACLGLFLALAAPARAGDAADTPRRAAQSSADERDMQERLGRDMGARTPHESDRPVYNIGTPHPAEQKDMEAQRQAEVRRLSEKLRKASEARRERTVADGAATQPWSAEVLPAPPEVDTTTRSALGVPADPADIGDNRVTILLTMTPGNKGIRRFDKTADPILCVQDGCYVSEGAGVGATFLPLRRALGPANTYGRRAAACSGRLGCVFRSIELSAGTTLLQPVDIRMISHDLRERQTISSADRTCVLAGETLSCLRPIRGSNYVLWIVPEALAKRAGAVALQAAVDAGLPPDKRAAELPWLR